LVLKQAEIASSTLWVALRIMEERKHLLKKMEVDSVKKGYNTLSENHVQRHDEMGHHIETLKKLLFDLQNQSID
jgi:two-component system chemotaxis response regulator CheB